MQRDIDIFFSENFLTILENDSEMCIFESDGKYFPPYSKHITNLFKSFFKIPIHRLTGSHKEKISKWMIHKIRIIASLNAII